MTCENYLIGTGGCFGFPEGIVGGLMNFTDAIITKANAKTSAGWQAVVAAATPATIKGIILNFAGGIEIEGGENELTQSNTKSTHKTDISNLRLKGFAEMSYEDYKQFYGMEGQYFRFTPINSVGNIAGTNKHATNFNGFLCKFWVKNFLPTHGADKAKQFEFMIEFVNMAEFGANVEILETAFDAYDLMYGINPVGIKLEIKTAYATGGLVIVKATQRTPDGREGAGVAVFDAVENWVIRKSIADIGVTVAVTSSANKALGEYSLTIKNGTPADIAGNVYLQGFDVSGNVMTYITNVIEINPAP